MKIFLRIALGISIVSLAVSIAASLLFGARAAFWTGLPALVVSGWAMIGHLVTIDEDAPGGWSNPENDPAIWNSSLRELAITIVIALPVAWLVLDAPLAKH